MNDRQLSELAARRKYGYFVLAALIPAAVYVWGFGYYRGLYQAGRLLSASAVTAETFSRTLFQNIFAILPDILAAMITLLLLGRKRFTEEMGLDMRSGKKLALSLAAGVCLLELAAALLFAKPGPLAVVYLWGYYFLLTAFMEELLFRGLLPFLIKRGGAPFWAVWIVPGALFACMHTLMPMVYNGFTLGSFAWSALAMLGGFTLGHCGFYALRRWSGTLWLPVLVHGLLDFSIIFSQ